MDNSPFTDAHLLISLPEDERVFRRFAPNMLAFVRLAERPALALADGTTAFDPASYTLQSAPVKDLSMTGVSFISSLNYPLKTELEMCLCLNHVEYRVTATVKRRRRAGNRFYGYGIDFVQSRTTKEFRIALASFLLRQDAAVQPAGALLSPRTH